MRKAMYIPLGVILAEWTAVSVLFLVALWWLKYKRPQEPPGNEPAVQDPLAQPITTVATWKRCVGCRQYARTAERYCSCAEQHYPMMPVSDKQYVRVFSALCMLDETVPEEEEADFGSFLLGYEERIGRMVRTKTALELYHLGQTHDEVTR